MLGAPFVGRFGNSHPARNPSVALLCRSGALCVFGADEPDRSFTPADVVERVRSVTGVKASAVEAGTACRAAVKEGLLRRLPAGDDGETRYQLTPAGNELRAEIKGLSKRLLAAFAHRIAELLPQYGAQGAGHIRFHLLSVLDILVVELILAKAYRVDPQIHGVVADLEALPDEAIADAMATVPARYRWATERLLRLTASGNDMVLRMALAHVTGIRLCELAACGRLQEQMTPEELERLGGVTVIEETSALVSMAETPARLAEGMRCLRDCVRGGHQVVVLSVSVEEYLTGLGDAVELLSWLVRRVADSGGDERWLAKHSWWVARAAAKHGLVSAMIVEAERCGPEERLPTVIAFIDRLLALPDVLTSSGVRVIDAESVSDERSRQWRSAVSQAKNVPVWDPRAGHDAKVLETVQAMRQSRPLVFVVSTDASLRAVWASVMGPQALAQLPATCKPAIASRVIVGLTPTGTFSGPWPDRSAAWVVPASHLLRVVANDPRPVGPLDDDDFLLADDGPFDDVAPSARWEQLQELADDAKLAVLTLAYVLETAEHDTAEPLGAEAVPALLEPEPEKAELSPTIHLVRDRRPSVVLVLATAVLTLLASIAGADDLFQDRVRGLSGDEVLAIGFGVLAWLAAGFRYRRTEDSAVLVLDLVATGLAVWGVALAA